MSALKGGLNEEATGGTGKLVASVTDPGGNLVLKNLFYIKLGFLNCQKKSPHGPSLSQRSP